MREHTLAPKYDYDDDDYDYFRTLNSPKAYSKQKQFVFADGNKEDIAAKYTYYNENDYE